MEARNRTLPEWFNRIRTGQIKLPRFQRFEAWGHDLVSGLLEAVLRELPAGATLILEVGEREPFISRFMEGAPSPTERPTEHLLDGQQRLTALWRSFLDKYEERTYFVYFEQDEEHNGREVARIHGQARWRRNNQRYPLWADNPKDLYNRSYIPLTLVRPEDIGQDVRNWCDQATDGDQMASRELELKILELRQIVRTYNIPFLSLPSTTPKDVALDVFIKLNTSSIRLTAFDIVVAQVEEVAQQSLHDLVDGLKRRVPFAEVYLSPSDLVLNVASLREDRSPTQASYQRLDPLTLINEWDKIVEGIAWAIQLLEEEHIFDGERLPTVAVVPVVAALHSFVPSSPDGLGNAKAILRKYMWRAFLTRRYENAAATKALQDMRGLRAMLQGNTNTSIGVPVFDESLFPFPTTIDELKQAAWPKGRDILARGILAITIKAGANDIADGTPANRSSLRNREYHHLFPDSLLTGDGGMLPQESYRALNCALLTPKTNRIISAKEPLRYLRDRTEASNLGEGEIKARLNSHLVPFDALAVGDYDQLTDSIAKQTKIRTDYDHFLTKRAEMLIGPIRALCEGRLWPS